MRHCSYVHQCSTTGSSGSGWVAWVRVGRVGRRGSRGSGWVGWVGVGRVGRSGSGWVPTGRHTTPGDPPTYPTYPTYPTHPTYPTRSERLQCLEHPFIIRLVPRVVEHFAVPDRARAVDDEDGAFGNALQPDHVLVEDAVVANHLLVEVAQERKRQLLLIVKCLEREKGVDADAIDARIGVVEPRQRVAEGAQLLRAHAAERRRKERQHHRMPALAAQRHRLALVVREREIRGLRAEFRGHHSSSLHFLCGSDSIKGCLCRDAPGVI